MYLCPVSQLLVNLPTPRSLIEEVVLQGDRWEQLKKVSHNILAHQIPVKTETSLSPAKTIYMKKASAIWIV